MTIGRLVTPFWLNPVTESRFFYQVLDDEICACKSRGQCTASELYTRLLYSQKECDYYPALENITILFDTAFLLCFSLEMACKVTARGFFWHKHAYLRDTNNWLDFIVVVTGILSVHPPLL